MTMQWDDKAVQALMGVPVALREMVAGRLEEHARGKGATQVMAVHMQELSSEYGIDAELMARFDA